ncbi:hypothetical protein [Metasolibacillus meyeri]|uniref:hypothetical protein n=1 Tax=Metasolibacillus meyeri TaxID=1071052 RepID=UPI000D31DE22|nr:hypothetical protein [Metasolibacillus meyeri]
MKKEEGKWVYVAPLAIIIVWLLTVFEPKGYNYIALALSSGLLAFIGYMRRKSVMDKFAMFLGVILFFVFVVLYFVK